MGSAQKRQRESHSDSSNASDQSHNGGSRSSSLGLADVAQAPNQIERAPIIGAFTISKARSYFGRSHVGIERVLAQPGQGDGGSPALGIQAKLKVGDPNDQYELEADRVADKVMQMPDQRVQRQEDEEEGQTKPLDGATVQRQEDEEEAQAKSVDGGTIQRQEEDEEEGQAKPLVGATVQRQEDEEEAQAKSVDGGTIQRREDEEETQAKPLDSATIQRQEDEEGAQAKTLDGSTVQRREDEEDAQAKSVAGGTVQRREEDEENGQRGPGGSCMRIADNASNRVPRMSSSTAADIDSLRGDGKPLSESERSHFEPRFGQDFSGVRLHTGPKATHLARSLSAKAFTRGGDIVWVRLFSVDGIVV